MAYPGSRGSENFPFADAARAVTVGRMSQTYRATVEDDRIRWHEGAHPDSRAKPIEVRVLVLDEPEADSPIVHTPGVCGGEPCFGSRRIPVRLVIEAWQMGWTDEEVLAAHPALADAHLSAAREYYRGHREEIDRLIAENAAA